MPESNRIMIALVDISGYTRFVVAHRKAQTHAQMIVGALLEALVAQIPDCLEVAEIEGDAILLYGRRLPGDDRAAAIERGECFLRLFRTFSATVEELAASAICRCPACANIDSLRIKIIVHSGQGVVSRIGRFTKVFGIDPVIAHRLLKNSVDSDEYLLLTDEARDDVAFPPELVFETGEEHYDSIGTVRTHVARNIAGPLGCARTDGPVSGTSRVGYEILRHEIRAEYAEVAVQPDKGFHFHTGAPLARMLGYSDEDVAWAADCSLASFAGTGNPFSVGPLRAGDRVVDIGCGAGFDALVAARHVGPTGRVIGVDMTPEMLDRARRGAAEKNLDNLDIVEGFAEALPIEDGWADVVVSNGVFNLCPNKPAVLREMFRVLKPGGRIQIGDILIQKALPESAKNNIDLWTG